MEETTWPSDFSPKTERVLSPTGHRVACKSVNLQVRFQGYICTCKILPAASGPTGQQARPRTAGEEVSTGSG